MKALSVPAAVRASVRASRRRALPRLAWPLPALLAWGSAWGVFLLLRPLAAPALAFALAFLAGASWAWPANPPWRRLMLVAGFPLSALAAGLAGAVPAWAWLLPMGLLLLAYPLRAWRDAPLYPTPLDALRELPRQVSLPAQARVLDAGCGLGHGLQALRQAWPEARIEGIEWSWALALAARRRCGFARVRRGDLWRDDWSGLDLVYLFQRPESMLRALAKAEREMPDGRWLVSLAFEVPGARAHAVLRQPGQRPLWLYRIGENVQLRSITEARGR